MDSHELHGYSEMDVQAVKKGQTIFLAGALGKHMYVVLEGQVEIKIGDRVVDQIRPGGIFGEMALVDERPRAGSAVALSDGRLLRLGEDQFQKLVKESPFFSLKVLRTVVERLRRSNAMSGTKEPASSRSSDTVTEN
jgi:CRP/FNR family transcriptional regulator, cyclic AMP receptor protein